MRSGGRPDKRDASCSGMKKNAIAAPCRMVGIRMVAEVGLRVEVRAHPQHEREDRRRRRWRSVRGSTLPMVLPTMGDSTIASRPDRRHRHAGRGGGVAHVLLQPQRQQHDVAEEQAVGDRQSPACRSRSCAARTGAGRPPDARRSAPRPGRTRSPPPRRRPARRSGSSANQSSSLPLSSMICSAPTQSTSSARPTRVDRHLAASALSRLR